MVTPAQLRAARTLIGWSQDQLAHEAGVPEISVKRIERGIAAPAVGSLGLLTRALERGGVQFGPQTSGALGVRLFKERLEGWLQCTVPFPGDAQDISNPFQMAWLVAGAPPGMALFSRITPEFQAQIFLVSPEAGRFVPLLAGDWVSARTPSRYGWVLEIGHARAFEGLGLRPSQDIDD